MPSRRDVILGLASLPAAGLLSPRVIAAEANLAALAREKGLFFGAALSSDQVLAGGRYAELLIGQCDVWTPEWQFNWAEVQPAPGPLVWDPAEEFAGIAAAHRKRIRGHPLLWHEQLPDWAVDLGGAEDWDQFVQPHLIAKAAQFEGRVFQWDVLNEAIEPEDGHPEGLRRSLFQKMRGDGYIAESFALAHAHAPSARLYLNDYDIYYDEGWEADRRRAVLRLLERLVADGVPIHGLGVQAHLDVRRDFSERLFADFLEEVAQLGLEIVITELDVREADEARGDKQQRLVRAAEEVRKVLGVALDQRAVKGVITWSLSDRHSWLRRIRKLPDNSGLPYDDDLLPTPMHAVLAELFANAPAR